MIGRLGCALLAGLWAASLAAETVIVGTEAGYPPIIFRDQTGALSGRDKEIGDEICRRAGWDCDWVETAFDDLLPGVTEGRFDIVIAGMTASPQRAEIVDFSNVYRQPTPNTTYYAGMRAGIDPATARISVQAGTTQALFLQSLGYDARPYPDSYAAFAAMLRGEVDLFFGGGLFLSEMADLGHDKLVANGQESVPSWGSGIAIAKGRDDMLAELNRVIQTMWEDGTLDRLNNKWTREGSDT